MSTPWVQTVGDRAVEVLAPTIEGMDLDDIAHSLASICRYNGHTSARKFVTRPPMHYSVAEHSVLMSRWFHTMDYANAARWALFHDAHEAWLGDTTEPVKRAIIELIGRWDVFLFLESQFDEKVRLAFGLPIDLPAIQAVKEADLRICATERDFFFPENTRPRDWGLDVEPLPVAITGWPAGVAKNMFLEQASLLGISDDA